MPVRSGVDCSVRLRAAAGPAVGAGMPELVWLNRVGLERWYAVFQPYCTPRLAVRGRRVCRSVMRRRGLLSAQPLVRAAAQRVGSRDAIVAGSIMFKPLADHRGS